VLTNSGDFADPVRNETCCSRLFRKEDGSKESCLGIGFFCGFFRCDGGDTTGDRGDLGRGLNGSIECTIATRVEGFGGGGRIEGSISRCSSVKIADDSKKTLA